MQKFINASLLLLTTIGIYSFLQINQQVESLSQQFEALHGEFGPLEIEDPKQLYARAIETQAPSTFAWTIYCGDRKAQVQVAQPDDIDGSSTLGGQAAPQTLVLNLHFDGEEIGVRILTQRSGASSSSAMPDFRKRIAFLNTYWSQLTIQDFASKQIGGQGPLPLLRISIPPNLDEEYKEAFDREAITPSNRILYDIWLGEPDDLQRIRANTIDHPRVYIASDGDSQENNNE